MLSRHLRLLAAIGAASAVVASALWLKILADAWPALFVEGPICGQPQHCPLCGPAWAFSAVSVLVLSASVSMARAQGAPSPAPWRKLTGIPR